MIVMILITGSASLFAQPVVTCMIRTSAGDITIELYPHKAPQTVQNFLSYVDQQLYDSSSFFRVCTPANEYERSVPIQVIQGGNVPEEKQGKPIDIETTLQTGLLHKNGTLSMARAEPNTATSEFFICINDQPSLDFGGKRNPDGQGFAAFGKVTKGMDIVQRIQQRPNKEQRLLAPVIIFTIRRI